MANNIIPIKSLQQSPIVLPSKIHDPKLLPVQSADSILTTIWPEPTWAVPGILPVGLGILAGAPKVGKSWLALQIALAVAAGGVVLGKNVEPGLILYLALEDPEGRLQDRMNKQLWPKGLKAEFVTIGKLFDHVKVTGLTVGNLLAYQIDHSLYRLVVIDTLSRAIKGNQKEVDEMTEALSPIQESAHKNNCAILLIDHHRKNMSESQDAIADILGSTAKGAMADTTLGLYRERNKSGARLSITGRDVEERNIEVAFDKVTWCWQLNEKGLTEQQNEIIDVLNKAKKPLGPTQIANELERDRGTVYKQLVKIEQDGLVKKEGEQWTLPEM